MIDSLVNALVLLVCQRCRLTLGLAAHVEDLFMEQPLQYAQRESHSIIILVASPSNVVQPTRIVVQLSKVAFLARKR